MEDGYQRGSPAGTASTACSASTGAGARGKGHHAVAVGFRTVGTPKAWATRRGSRDRPGSRPTPRGATAQRSRSSTTAAIRAVAATGLAIAPSKAARGRWAASTGPSPASARNSGGPQAAARRRATGAAVGTPCAAPARRAPAAQTEGISTGSPVRKAAPTRRARATVTAAYTAPAAPRLLATTQVSKQVAKELQRLTPHQPLMEMERPARAKLPPLPQPLAKHELRRHVVRVRV